MREILFKGQSINGDWHEGLLAKDKSGWYISNSVGAPKALQVRPDSVCQFTGAVDAMGTKIFEQDLLRMTTGDGIIWMVCWEQELYGYVLRDCKTSDFRQSLSVLTSCSYEVVGNWVEVLNGGVPNGDADNDQERK